MSSSAPTQQLAPAATPAAPTSGAADAEMEMNLSIMEVMSMYDDAPQDGVISPVEFAHLVGDLLCLRDGLLWQPTEFVRSVASALAQQIQHEFGAPVVHFEARHFLWLARSWPTVLEAPTVFHVGGPMLGMKGSPCCCSACARAGARRRCGGVDVALQRRRSDAAPLTPRGR